MPAARRASPSASTPGRTLRRCACVSAYQPCRDCLDPEVCALRRLMRESRDALSQVQDQRSLRDFAIAVIVHNTRVVQITRSQKFRFNDR